MTLLIQKPTGAKLALSLGNAMSWKLSPIGTGENLLYSQAGTPSLDLRFASSKSLIDYVNGQNLITFTRASSGTYVGSDGLIKTATTDEPRFDHDPTTGESLGLLVEEQRTNLLLNSATLSTQSVTVAAVAHTLSFYGTGTVTLSGTSTAGPALGSGAYPTKTTLTFTPTAGTLTLTVTGSVTNAQLEAGAFPTSYIPTTTATVTRSADVASITGTNFSSWYRQDEGTVFAEGVIYNTGSNRFIADITNSGVTEELGLYWSTTFNSLVNDGGVSQANSFGGTVTANSRTAHAFGYKLDDFQGYGNAVALSSDTSGTLPTPDRLTIGRRVNNTFWANGTIRRLTFWPQRISNSTLQAITQ